MTNQPIMIMELIERYRCDEKIAESAPELAFIWELGKRVKKQGCYCGLSGEIAKLADSFNNIVENLSQETVMKMLKFLNKDELCFGILKPNQFYTKCYSNEGKI